jgi:hypothetical protein
VLLIQIRVMGEIAPPRGQQLATGLPTCATGLRLGGAGCRLQVVTRDFTKRRRRMKLPTLRIAGTLALATTVLNGTSASALERQRARQVQAPSSIACTTVVEPVCARDKTGTLKGLQQCLRGRARRRNLLSGKVVVISHNDPSTTVRGAPAGALCNRGVRSRVFFLGSVATYSFQ